MPIKIVNINAIFSLHFQLYVSVGSRASSIVTDSVIADIKSTFASYKANGQLAAGLLAIAEKLRLKLRHVTPAHVLLILNVLAVVATGIVLFLFFHVRDLEYNVWGREGVWLYVEKVAYILSGGWMISGLMYLVLMMSVKAPFWGIIFTFIAGVVTVFLYIFEEQIFPDQDSSGSFNYTM